jgi:23S rRNA-intervening sequence protein
MGDYKDLIVFEKGYKLAMGIFQESKKFPSEERFSLTSKMIPVSLRQSCRGISKKKI